MNDYRPDFGLYRARDGVILGVCKGLAQYLEFSVFWMRVIALVLLFLSGIIPAVIFYFLAAILLKPAPAIPFSSYDDREFYNSYVSSRSMALHRLKKSFDNLDRRIRRMEDIVTAKDYDWDRRFNDQ
jgi:phage shock protein C